MTPKTHQELVERVARRIFETWAAAGNSDATWDELVRMQPGDGYAAAKGIYELALKEAEAAISEVYAALDEPNNEMIGALWSANASRGWPEAAKTCWQAALAASPLAKEGE